VPEITTANVTARRKYVRDSRHNREDFGVIKETLQRRTHAQGATAEPRFYHADRGFDIFSLASIFPFAILPPFSRIVS